MKELNNTELVSFCSQLALILHSGISPLEGLLLMAGDSPRGGGRQILEQTARDLETTGSLYTALQKAEVFPTYMCSMVEIGEQTGSLDNVMESLAAHYTREEDVSRNIRSAVLYPLIMLGMLIVIMAVLLMKVMPVFQQVFEQLGAGMTGLPAAALSLGNNLKNYAAVFLILICAAAFAALFAAFTRKGKKMARSFSYHFFITRGISEKLSCSRFASGMHLCLNSGLDIDQGLEMTERMIDHPVIRERIMKLRLLTSQGGSFAEALAETGLFPGIYAQMLSIGFRTGSTAEVMKQISERYDRETEERIDNVVARLEPALVALFSIIAGIILLSVMLPLIGIMSNIG